MLIADSQLQAIRLSTTLAYMHFFLEPFEIPIFMADFFAVNKDNVESFRKNWPEYIRFVDEAVEGILVLSRRQSEGSGVKR